MEDNVEKHREKTTHHLSAKERGLEQTLTSQPSEGTNPASTLILDL